MNGNEEVRSTRAQPAELPRTAALVERFQQRVGSYLLRLVGDLDAALLLAEHTFVRAHRAGLSIERGLSAQTWLYRVATQLAFAQLRRQQPNARSDYLSTRRDRGRALAEDREVVRAVLAQLSPDQRAVLLLCDGERLSKAEVAVILGGSPERIEWLLERARTRFRQLHLLEHTLAQRNPNGAATTHT